MLFEGFVEVMISTVVALSFQNQAAIYMTGR